MNLRLNLQKGVTLGMVMASAFVMWKLISIVTLSNSPLVVVLSGSMEPAFQRGDILFLWNRDDFVDVGDVVVYNTVEKAIPIVHRVVREHKVVEPITVNAKSKGKGKGKYPHLKKQVENKRVSEDGKSKISQKLLTKGDNNEVDDLGLYPYNKQYLDRDQDIVGRVRGYIPKVGYVTILITENVYFKYGLLGLLLLSTLIQQE